MNKFQQDFFIILISITFGAAMALGIVVICAPDLMAFYNDKLVCHSQYIKNTT